MPGHQCGDEVAVPRSRSSSQQAEHKTTQLATVAITRKMRRQSASADEEEARLDRLHADYIRWLAQDEVQPRLPR